MIFASLGRMSEQGILIRNITLFAVLIYEIVGPFLTKIALTKSGEIKKEERKSAREEHIANKKLNEINKIS